MTYRRPREFPVVVYLVVLAVVAIAVVFVRGRVIGARVRDVPVADPYATAYLAGGPRRVALLAIGDMVDAGELIVEGRRLRRRCPNDEPIDPIRAAVLRGFGTEQRVPAIRVLEQAARQPELGLWAQPLRRKGMLATPTRRVLTGLIPVPLTLTALAYGPIVVLDLAQGGPGVLVLAPIAIIVLVVSIGMIVGTPRQTPVGREMVYRAERAQRRGRPDPVVVDGRSYPAVAFVHAARGRIHTRNPELSVALFGSGD